MIFISRTTFCNALITSIVLSPQPPTATNTSLSTDHYQIIYEPSSQFIRNQVTQIIQNDPTIAGPILRLAFHDAVVRSKASSPFVGGADGSIRYELDWSENRGLSRPLQAIQTIYESQLIYCQSILDGNNMNKDSSYQPKCQPLSFADTLSLSGAAAVEAAEGPHIPIKLGRSDSYAPDNKLLDEQIKGETDRSTIKTSLPSAALDSLGLRLYFRRIGMSETEMVALMGAHDLGRHVTLTGMPKECLRNLTRTCLEDAPVLAPFITKDPDTFSNSYYDTLLRWNERKIEYGEAAFIPTDVSLVVDDRLKKIVKKFANDERFFFQTFTTAYQKLVDSTATTSIRY